MSKLLSWNSIYRDTVAASSAIAALISGGLISGTAERWTTGVLTGVTAFVVTFVRANSKAENPSS